VISQSVSQSKFRYCDALYYAVLWQCDIGSVSAEYDMV
jgi:hypothetical protein